MAGDRQRQRQRRAVDARGALDVESPAASAAPVPPAHTSACALPSATARGGLHDRGVRCRAHRARGVGALGDRDRRVDHLDPRRGGYGAELARGGPEQQHPRALLRGQRRAGRDLRRAEVRAVRVDRDDDVGLVSWLVIVLVLSGRRAAVSDDLAPA